MIKELNIKNFRCFNDTTINFKGLSVIVGKNNAGKSTLIEALRIISIAVNRAPYISYTRTPKWLKLDEQLDGISPSIENMDISTKNIFHQYGKPPAVISAY